MKQYKKIKTALQASEALIVLIWSRLSYSNRGPTVYKTVAINLKNIKKWPFLWIFCGFTLEKAVDGT